MLPAVSRYLQSVKARDPAARSSLEVMTYPGTWALALHRLAHGLYHMEYYFPARLINHLARFLTGIDIHPGAVIGRNFFADHGFAVIGETAVIGDDVTIYSGVTLGGANPVTGTAGKRHPTIGDGVVIGSGAQIIGAITVRSGAKVGANAVVTKDVPEGSVVAGVPARQISGSGGDREGAGPDEPLSELAPRIAAIRAELVGLLQLVDQLESRSNALSPKEPRAARRAAGLQDDRHA